MDLCPICKKRLWPWTEVLFTNRKLYHPSCYHIHSNNERIERIITMLAEYREDYEAILKLIGDIYASNNTFQKELRLIDERDQDLMKKVMVIDERDQEIMKEIMEIQSQQLNTLEYYPEILEEVRKNQTILDLRVATREEVKAITEDVHRVMLFDPILMRMVLKITGQTPQELIEMIKNKEIKRMLNDIKKQDQGGN